MQGGRLEAEGGEEAPGGRPSHSPKEASLCSIPAPPRTLLVLQPWDQIPTESPPPILQGSQATSRKPSFRSLLSEATAPFSNPQLSCSSPMALCFRH